MKNRENSGEEHSQKREDEHESERRERPGDPSQFLSGILDSQVKVKLNSGLVYEGHMKSIDGYMNIALERVREIAEGRVQNEFGDLFVRGNNVLYIQPLRGV
jgi:U6 snRNA-associated Sm-like protein LSm6